MLFCWTYCYRDLVFLLLFFWILGDFICVFVVCLFCFFVFLLFVCCFVHFYLVVILFHVQRDYFVLLVFGSCIWFWFSFFYCFIYIFISSLIN